ncbi:Cation-transporting atpase [Thalictrum thalictroides]|uniref:Cation-transporting atpase n=1 Tax=Thalictrum thalictroides TaxID=46969 RepID=A0A7J6UZE0_THATH|nr:Cation-transporting atpase [Thalictrum thalictroides]
MELNPKRKKMRDLDSVLRSQEGSHNSETLDCEANNNQLDVAKNEETSEITKETVAVISDASEAVAGKNKLSDSCVDSDLHLMDLTTKAHFANESACDVDDKCKDPLFAKKDKVHKPNFVQSRGIELDLNADGASKSAEKNPFYPYKPSGCVKSTEASECGSSTGPLEENDAYKRWKEMKKNGFLSSAHGGIPVPAPRARKRKTDPLKKKMEIAKREQVHRFTKIAAPSGLLNGLNPGIINHVRNSKQVHAIIEAIVRSNKIENNTIENIDIQDSGDSQLNEYLKPEHKYISYGNKDYTLTYDMPLTTEHKGGCSNSEITERLFQDETSDSSYLTSDRENEMLALKISSSITSETEYISGSNEESVNHASVSSLSVKAATVASQWLELLYQDIRGRLAALRRSKKRVQAVIQTELPFLMLKEFSSTKENNPYFKQSHSSSYPNTEVTDMHRARWTALFDQMDKALTEEGKHLEIWLDQVKEMQLQCERGLQVVNLQSLQSLGQSESDSRLKTENTEKELAVKAAAASIYSACNFIKTTEDVSCF